MAADRNDEYPSELRRHADLIDPSTFEQILEMDDDSSRDFSKSIVYGYFDQASSIFEKMKEALAGKRLAELSELGHFLKGSSATLGLVKVKDDCERIQHCQEDVGDNLDDPKILDTIKGYITDAQDNHREVEVILRRFYGESIESPPAAAAASTATPTPAAAPSSTTSATAAAAAAAAGAPTPAGAAGTGTAAAASVPAGAGAGKQSPEGGGTGKEEKLTEKSVK